MSVAYADGSDTENPVTESTAGLFQFGPAFLVYAHLILCCVSLIYVAKYYPEFNIFFSEEALSHAVFGVLIVALMAPLFSIARFSFGYFIGFYIFSMSAGYVWLSYFTPLDYDLESARTSAIVSSVAFLLPALFLTWTEPPRRTLSIRSFDLMLNGLLLISAVSVVLGASYGFKVVGLQDMYRLRAELNFPTALSYLLGITSSALLPFAFASYLSRRKYALAVCCLFVSLLLYPVTLNKITLMTAAWLVYVVVLARIFEARTTVILSLMVPLMLGIVSVALFDRGAIPFFGTINFRMIAIPSSAMDHYNHFFATHELTGFCQISFLKPFMECPYSMPLAVVFAQTYHLGNFNASMLATEGIASVGLAWAPLSALMCGGVIAVGNRAAAGLPAHFLLTSSAILPMIFLNVPLTTTLLTNGAAVLFLLWRLTPREIFSDLSRRRR